MTKSERAELLRKLEGFAQRQQERKQFRAEAAAYMRRARSRYRRAARRKVAA